MKKEQNRVVNTTQVEKSDRMFNITEVRNQELTDLASPYLEKYENSEITNCELVEQLLTLTDDQDEKYYLAYQAGVFVQSQSFGF